MIWILLAAGLVVGVTIYDISQRKHAILRNFPVIGHFRYLLESVGPELRQYIVTDNNEERPFSRDQRRWVYASSKHQNNYFGFGTDNDLEQSPSYIIVKQVAFPIDTPRPGDQATIRSTGFRAGRSWAAHAAVSMHSVRLPSSTRRR